VTPSILPLDLKEGHCDDGSCNFLLPLFSCVLLVVIRIPRNFLLPSLSLGHVLFISLSHCFTIITNNVEALGFFYVFWCCLGTKVCET